MFWPQSLILGVDLRHVSAAATIVEGLDDVALIRGNNRARLFGDAQDHEAFLSALANAQQCDPCRLHGSLAWLKWEEAILRKPEVRESVGTEETWARQSTSRDRDQSHPEEPAPATSGGKMKRSYHSHLTRMVREAHAACREASALGMPIDEVTDVRAERARQRTLSRRDFLSGTGSLLAGSGIWSSAEATAGTARSQPRIVIVGAGLAGIRCAHQLWMRRRIRSTIYEWDGRVGGRVETLRGFFGNGQIVEQHGEFVSSEHTSMLRLAGRYGLTLDLADSYPPNTESVCWFNGGPYTQAQLNADWQRFGWALFRHAAKLAPWPTRYNSFNRYKYILDHTSVVEWIDRYVPGGMALPFGRLCCADVISEYGGPPEEQSALNLIYLLGYDDSVSQGSQPQTAPALAGTDEKYHIKGGNDQIVTNMINELPAGTIKTGQRLVALRASPGGSYTCTFESDFSIYEIRTDHVVLAIPFTTLRHVDLSQAHLSPLKMRAIQNLPLGTNAKIQLQFKNRVWNHHGLNGNTYADNGAACTWECSNYQPGSTGILIDLPGGIQGAQLGAKYQLSADEGAPPPQLVSDTLRALEPIIPGVVAAFTGLAYCSVGVLDPHLLGAWSQYNIGQYTGFSGIEPKREGNIHFAGEQTSLDFQGFMEGAVRSGERAAGEI